MICQDLKKGLELYRRTNRNQRLDEVQRFEKPDQVGL
jgi:hypothetical protein